MIKIRKTISLTLSVILLLVITFVVFESEVAKGIASPDSINVTLTVTENITMNSPADIALTSITGMASATVTGTATWTVKTNNDTGYNLGMKSGTTPAMQAAGLSIADYTPAIEGTPDYTWALGTASAEFGFSPYNATSQTAKFKNSGAACNTGANITQGQCWLNFTGTDVQTANRSSETLAAGEANVLWVEVQVDVANGYVEDGAYSATITATATTN